MSTNLCHQIARQLRTCLNGNNWTAVSLKDCLAGVDHKMATRKLDSFNSIAGLVYHMNYYVKAATRVLRSEPINASDKFSFDHPVIKSEEDWQNLIDGCFSDAEILAGLIEQFPEEKLWDIFYEEKYGSYYRNFQGITEHYYYHMGQIMLLKKWLSV